MNKKYAYYTLLTNDDYCPGALLLHNSLQNVNSKYPLITMVTEMVSQKVRDVLTTAGVIVQQVDTWPGYDKFYEYNLTIHQDLADLWRYTGCKFHAFTATEYDKVIFIDADIIVLKNLDHLFEKPHMTAALDGEIFSLWPTWPHFNSGFMVIKPSLQFKEDMAHFIETVDLPAQFPEQICADQDILNALYSDWVEKTELHLDKYHNVFSGYLLEQKDYLSENIVPYTHFLHFVGIKPWQSTMYEEKEYLSFLKDMMNQVHQQMNALNKVAIYAICKNEEYNVDSWMESILNADYICVLDTGSTDDTYKKFQKWQKEYPNKIILNQAEVSPWRFDVARNKSMELIPADANICMSIDLDERLAPNWKAEILTYWTNDCNMMWYKYSWSTEESNPTIFWYDHIHSRNGWQWKYPVHEALEYTGEKEIVSASIPNTVMLYHYPNDASRNYLPLLEVRYNENQNDWMSGFYLAREYYLLKQWKECKDFILGNFFKDKSYSLEPLVEGMLFYWIGISHYNLNDLGLAEVYFNQGVQASPILRDNYLALAQIKLDQKDYKSTIDIIHQCLNETKRQYSWIENNKPWGAQPYDLLSLAYYYNDNKNVAYHYAILAAQLEPENQRLINNVEIIKSNM